MITALLAGALAISIPQQQMDTTFDVRRGGELELEALNGAVTIDSWDRPAMRVRATHRGTTRIELDHSGSTVSIETEDRGMSDPVTFQITVPRNYNLDIEGVALRISVAGVQGSVSLENVEGAIVVRDITGALDVESVSGSLTIQSVSGSVSAATVNEAISLTGVRGSIDAETVNGSIVMRGIDAESVDASTVNGIVDYDGVVHDGGEYFLGTHNGRITMAIPEGTNARIAIDTQNGRVESVFPVRVTGTGEREYRLTLGSGSASIQLESYNGTINLVRPRAR